MPVADGTFPPTAGPSLRTGEASIHNANQWRLPNLGHSADPAAGMAAATDFDRSPDRTLTYAAIIIVAGVLATTLAQPQVLARLPLQNLLKNELHLDRSSN